MKILIAFLMLISSVAFAWSPGFDIMAKELKAAIPIKYNQSAIIEIDGHYSLYSPACLDKNFVLGLRKKYGQPKESQRIWNLDVNSIECKYGQKSSWIFRGGR